MNCITHHNPKMNYHQSPADLQVLRRTQDRFIVNVNTIWQTIDRNMPTERTNQCDQRMIKQCKRTWVRCFLHAYIGTRSGNQFLHSTCESLYYTWRLRSHTATSHRHRCIARTAVTASELRGPRARSWTQGEKARSARTWEICTRRAGKLYKARSRLYRSQILQVNARVKALAEI